jgi:phosphohistidine phosphatase
MKFYLIQHGEAKSEAEDRERSLTARGEEEVRRVATVATRMGIRASSIYHSGKRRAQQTAEIMASALGLTAVSFQGLNPLDDVRPWAERISKEEKDLMIVGHLPFLEKLTSLLLCGNESAGLILFRYGGIVCLHRKEVGGWAVQWVLTPEMASSVTK